MEINIFALLVSIIAIAHSSVITDDYNYPECNANEDVCEYWLVIQEKLTMIDYKDGSLVYSHQGKLIRYDEHPSNYTTEVPMDDIVTVDGVHRMVIAVNGTVPGPPIIAYVNQKIRVHVKNLLLSDAVTLHWHGQHQRGTPYMDGIGYVSQCPIASGQSFTYEFKAEPVGTYWYHSHVGAQRSNGVYGALIIKEIPKSGVTLPIDVIMSIGDFHHFSSEEVYMRAVYGNYAGRKAYIDTKTLDGGKFSGVPWNSALIEGKGRFIDKKTGEGNGAPLTWYHVKKGQQYRFRVIGVGSMYPIRVSVDQHMLTIVASDGYDVKPMVVESFIINPGERFDFLLTADKEIDNYWVRGESIEVDVSFHSVEAILSYSGANKTEEPITRRKDCKIDKPCVVANCPFYYYFNKNINDYRHIECKLMTDFVNAVDEPAPEMKEGSQEHFLNFAFPGDDEPGAINGRKFEFPGVNSLFQRDEIDDYDCSKHDCGDGKVCYCHYQVTMPYNNTIQMVLVNKGSGSGWGHPIHLHGHSFYVVKMEYAPQSKTTGLLIGSKGDSLGENQDIVCSNPNGRRFCNSPSWKNPSWGKDNLPGLNLKNPPRKDTLIIPTGGYAVIRIRTDNPGKWFMHCHVEEHMLDGMAMIIDEAPDQVPKPPKGFPICQNFYNDPSRDLSYIREKRIEHSEKDTCINSTLFIAICCVFGAVLIIQTLLIVNLCKKRVKGTISNNKSFELQ